MNKEFLQTVQAIKSAPSKLLTRGLYPSGKQWTTKCKEEGSQLLRELMSARKYHAQQFKIYNIDEHLYIESYSDMIVDLDVKIVQTKPNTPYRVIHNENYAKALKGRLRQEVVFCSTMPGNYEDNKNRFLLVHKDWEALSSGKRSSTYAWDSNTKADAASIIDVCFTSSGNPLITLKPNHGKCPWKPKSFRSIDDMMSFEELEQLTGYKVTASSKEFGNDFLTVDLSHSLWSVVSSDTIDHLVNLDIPNALHRYAQSREPSYPRNVFLSICKRLKQNKNRIIMCKSDNLGSMRHYAKVLTIITRRPWIKVEVAGIKNEVYIKDEKYLTSEKRLFDFSCWHFYYEEVNRAYANLFYTYNSVVALNSYDIFLKDRSITNFVNNLKRPARVTAMELFSTRHNREEVLGLLKFQCTSERTYKYLGLD